MPQLQEVEPEEISVISAPKPPPLEMVPPFARRCEHSVYVPDGDGRYCPHVECTPATGRGKALVLRRCEHGVYNPEEGSRARYCTICTPITIQGEVSKRINTAIGPLTLVVEKRVLGYDVNKYREEINTGLKYARLLLPEFATSWRDSNDLKQTVDIEIAAATKRYEDGMNPALAYTIAKNQAGKFLTNQIKEQNVEVEDEFGEPILDEFGEEKRVARFESFDAKGTDEDGEPRENSRIEEKIVMDALPPPTGPTLDKLISDFAKINRFPLLQRLVDGWKPGSAKRIVGEVFLAMPDATVRDFLGVPKSTAARVLKVVKAEFSAVLLGEVGQES
jgi:hypothetical protein